MYIVRWDDSTGQLHTLAFDDLKEARQEAADLEDRDDVEWVYPIEEAGINSKKAPVLERLRNLERKEDMLTWITLLEALVLAVLAWRTVMG